MGADVEADEGLLAQAKDNDKISGYLGRWKAYLPLSTDGTLIALTYHEFAVLTYLARHPGWVFSASQIYEAVWDRDGERCGTAVASIISQIRRKLTPDTPKGGYIRTILGSGYKFSSSPF